MSELLGRDEVTAGSRWGTGSRWVAERNFFVCTPPDGREFLTAITPPQRPHWVAASLEFFLPGRHEKSLRTTDGVEYEPKAPGRTYYGNMVGLKHNSYLDHTQP